MSTLNAISVHAAAPTAAHLRLPVRTADGTKTSVSLPLSLFTTYVTQYGSRPAFREALNAISRTLTPRTGYSRSMSVRLALEAELSRRTQQANA